MSHIITLDSPVFEHTTFITNADVTDIINSGDGNADLMDSMDILTIGTFLGIDVSVFMGHIVFVSANAPDSAIQSILDQGRAVDLRG